MDIQWKSEWTVPSIVGVVSFGVGVGVGYAIYAYRDRRLVRSFDEVMEEVEAKKNDTNGHDSEVFQLVEEWEGGTVTDIIDKSKEHHPSNSHIADPVPNISSIFPDEEPDDWDYEEEMKTRTPDEPYIIHRNEYEDVTADDGISYSKSTLTYYQGDDVLCDEQDKPIYNYQKTASPLTFGKGSQDPSIVYIRNEKLEADYEVLLDHGYYAVEVLGVEMEESFNNKKEPLPKFKEE